MVKTKHETKRSVTKRMLTRKLWMLVVIALLVVGPLPRPEVHAATINVTSTADVIADDGQCTLREAIQNANDTTDGQADNDDCTSGNPAGADTIVLQMGQTYTLSLDTAAGDENGAAQDDLDVRSQITIQGNGATIKRGSMDCDLDGVQEIGEFRIFQVLGGGDLTLENVTIENGCAEGSFGGGIVNQGKLTVNGSTISGNSAYLDGGGIFNDTNRQMTITNSTISNNFGDDNGGGIFNNSSGTVTITGGEIKFNQADFGGAIYNQGTVTITGNTTISDNEAFNDGGGIFNEGTLTIMGSTISDNSADDSGGGIFNVFAKTVTITNSTISGNSADDSGGGIFNSAGTATITNSTITLNTAEEGDGGGIFNNDTGTLSITGGTISKNTAVQDGGGILNRGVLDLTGATISENLANRDGGGIANNDGTATIMNSVISKNKADQDADGSGSGGGISNGNGGGVDIKTTTISLNTADEGGGIFNFDYNPNRSEISIETSTISDNEARGPGGGLGNGGILEITNSTISGNKTGDASGEDGGGIWNDGTVNASFVTIANNSAGASGQGGGIFNAMGGTFNIKNSIVGNNTAPTGPNCSGTLTPTGANLATDTMTSCGTTNFAYVASTGAGGLNLGPLQVNAPGTTATHALQSGSAAIDAVTDCSDLLSQQVTDDQRGVSRPLNGDGAGMALCDAGAYEAPAQSPSPPPSNVLRLQGNGHCLEVDRDRRIYRFRAANGRVFTGPLTFTQRGSKLEFQSPRGQSPLLKGTIDLNRRTGSAALVAPLSQGGGRYVITDRSIDDNGACP